jgi:hypothetical protein
LEEGKNMRISCRVLVCAAFCALVAAYAPPARAGLLNFSFSFTDDPTVGTTPGTVTGEIDGLSDNSTSAASDVIIDTVPAALDNLEGPLPIDLTAAGWTFLLNSFTVSGGQITDGTLYAFDSGSKGTLVLDAFNKTGLTLDGSFKYVENDGGPAGVTYAPLAAASVPEPASFQIGLASLPIVGLWFWKKRRASVA